MTSAALSKLTGLASTSKSSTQDGYVALKAVIERSEADVEDLIAFLDAKRQLDESYAAGLEKLQRRFAAGAEKATRSNAGSSSDLTLEADLARSRTDSTFGKAWEALRAAATGAHAEHSRLASVAENDILPMLWKFRETQKKTLQAIKSDLKSQSKEYNELRWISLAKLKKGYDAKAEELDKAAAKFAAKSEQMMEQEAFGEVPEKKWLGLGGENTGSKTFRLTEELKAADQAYRLGVLSLEDCRYKLEDVANRGFAELERLETEKLDIAQRACSRYARAQDTLANKQMDLVKTCLKSVDAMRAELDLERFRGDIRHAWIGPDRVLYDKYGYGKLKDLTFGVDLDRHLQGKARLVPFLVEKCVKTLERRGLDREGLYRVPALASAVTALRNKHEEDESVDFDIISEAEDVSVVAALLKLYLRELPQALFVLSDKDRADYSRISDAGQRMMKLRHMVRMLPHANQATLRCIVEHLCRVASHSVQNRMTISSLAKIFGAIMFNTSTPETTKPAGADKKTSAAEAAVAAAELFKADCVIVEDMCNWHNFVFEINEPAAIPPRRESSHHSPTGSVSSSASSDRLRSPTKPHASPKVDHKGMHLDPIRSTKLGDFKGPLAMP